MLRSICPHWFGWVYAKPAEHRRWCRICGHPQVKVSIAGKVDWIEPWRIHG